MAMSLVGGGLSAATALLVLAGIGWCWRNGSRPLLVACLVPFGLIPPAALLGKSQTGRDHLVEHAGTLSIIKGDWKYIEPSKGAKRNAGTNTELGNDPQPQLYNLKDDLGEKKDLAAERPEMVKEMAALLAKIRSDGRSRPQ